MHIYCALYWRRARSNSERNPCPYSTHGEYENLEQLASSFSVLVAVQGLEGTRHFICECEYEYERDDVPQERQPPGPYTQTKVDSEDGLLLKETSDIITASTLPSTNDSLDSEILLIPSGSDVVDGYRDPNASKLGV